MVFDEIKDARLWTADDNTPMNVALELGFFQTRQTMCPSGFGTSIGPGRVY